MRTLVSAQHRRRECRDCCPMQPPWSPLPSHDNQGTTSRQCCVHTSARLFRGVAYEEETHLTSSSDQKISTSAFDVMSEQLLDRQGEFRLPLTSL